MPKHSELRWIQSLWVDSYFNYLFKMCQQEHESSNLHHIRTRSIIDGTLIGEISVTDYVVFYNISELSHVSRFWDSLVIHALSVDQVSARLATKPVKANASDPENFAWLQDEKRNAVDAHNYLTRASILSLLASFAEFCLLESYKIVFCRYPDNPKPRIDKDLKIPLEKEIGPIEFPEIYKQTVVDSRDSIRNALQHGRWMNLKDESEKIDLHEAFIGIVSYTTSIEEALRKSGKIN